jgi:hypothetical protein
MEEMLAGLLDDNVRLWVDDALCHASTEDEYLDAFEQLLQRCEEYGVKLSAQKCTLFATSIEFCGKVISAEGVRHAPDRIEAIEKAPAPKTAKELQQWIGTVGWVSAHIPRCSTTPWRTRRHVRRQKQRKSSYGIVGQRSTKQRLTT